MRKNKKIYHVTGGDLELDEDCAICQGMKKAEEDGRELDYSELMELFKIQNKNNRHRSS